MAKWKRDAKEKIDAQPKKEKAAVQATTTSETEYLTLSSLVNFLSLGGVTEDKMSQATYFACLKILTESIGKLPLKLMRTIQDGGEQSAVGHPLYSVLKYRPNRIMTSTGFWGTMELQRNEEGNSYALIDGIGRKTQLLPLNPQNVSVWYDDSQIFTSQARLWYIYDAPNKKRYKFTDEEILHFRTSMSLDGIVGMSVRDILSSNIDGLLSAQSFQNDLYNNGMTAKLALQYTSGLSDELRDKFVTEVERFATGNHTTSKNIIPIPVGSTVTPLNIKLTDAQFLELKKHSALEIAAAFGIKPNQINDYEKASYASAEAQQLAFYVDTLLYIIKQYEDELSFKLLTDEERENGYHFKFNVAVILRADNKTQVETLTTAIQQSLYTPNEARAFVDMPHKEGGDDLLCNGTMLPVAMAGKNYGKEVQNE
jgi:HK97 family phage portal protein